MAVNRFATEGYVGTKDDLLSADLKKYIDDKILELMQIDGIPFPYFSDKEDGGSNLRSNLRRINNQIYVSITCRNKDKSKLAEDTDIGQLPPEFYSINRSCVIMGLYNDSAGNETGVGALWIPNTGLATITLVTGTTSFLFRAYGSYLL